MNKSSDATREPQYQPCIEHRDAHGLTPLGVMSNKTWHDDPKRLTFVLSRYKFVAKMFSGFDNVLEVGCADAFAARIVLQEVKKLTAVDFDPVFVRDANERMDPQWPFACRVHDILAGPMREDFDGIYSLDVLEHIPAGKERVYIRNLVDSLKKTGVLIVGTPSLESQAYASEQSRQGHVNCKSGAELKRLFADYFHNVFLFSMNDEVVHTGFAPMAHYLFALCCTKK